MNVTFTGIKEFGVHNAIFMNESIGIGDFSIHNFSSRLTSADLEEFKPVLDQFPHADGGDVFAMSVKCNGTREASGKNEVALVIDSVCSEININGHLVPVDDKNSSVLGKICNLMKKINNPATELTPVINAEHQELIINRAPFLRNLTEDGINPFFSQCRFDTKTFKEVALDLEALIMETLIRHFQAKK